MMDNPHVEPKVPMVNRYCWELSFNKTFNDQVMEFVKSKYSHHKNITFSQFKKDFFESFEEYLWRDNIEDLLFALETNRKVNLRTENGKIVKIKFL